MDAKQSPGIFDQVDEEISQKLVDIAKAAARDAIRIGLVDPRGKSQKELWIELFQCLMPRFDSKEILFVRDHTNTLQSRAAFCREAGEHCLSCLLYATWAEHWLNGLIATAAERQEIEYESISQMIREVPLRGKFTWLLNLLGLPTIDPEHRNATLRLMDLRNQFVHYKWVGRREDHEKQEEEDVARVVHAFPSTVNYLLAYEEEHIYAGTSDMILDHDTSRTK